MSEIIVLNPQDFDKCSNIWDIKKNKAMAQKWLSQIESGKRITFVYTDNSVFLGEVSLVEESSDADYTVSGKRIYLSRLIVKKENRRQGIGTALCKYAFQVAKEKGYQEMSLGVDLDNYNAIKLYYELGFDRIIFVGEDKDGRYIKMLKNL